MADYTLKEIKYKINSTTTEDVKGLNIDDYKWRKPYNVTIPTDITGVDTITVTRTATESNCGQLTTPSSSNPVEITTSGIGVVLHGDTVSVSATAETGYQDPTVSFNESCVTDSKVTGDITLAFSGNTGKGKTYYIEYKNDSGWATGGTLPTPNPQLRTYPSAATIVTNNMTKKSTTDATYTVTFNYNGSGASNTTATAKKIRTYTANGWTTTEKSTTQNYANGTSFGANSTTNLTLFPCFSQSVDTETVTLPSPTRTGYTFKGWATSSTATSGTTGSYTPTGNVTLYAIWQAKEFTITIDNLSYGKVSCGSWVLTSSSAKVAYGSTLRIIPTAVTGYTTTVTSSTGTLEEVTAGAYDLIVDGDETITFTRTINTYKVSYPAMPTGVQTFEVLLNETFKASNPTEDGSFMANYKDTVSVRATPVLGYQSPDIVMQTNGTNYGWSSMTVSSDITIILRADLMTVVEPVISEVDWYNEGVIRFTITNNNAFAVNYTAAVKDLPTSTATTLTGTIEAYGSVYAYYNYAEGWSGASINCYFTYGAATSATTTWENDIRTFTVTIASNNSTWGTVSPTKIENVPYGTEVYTNREFVYVGDTQVTPTPAAQTDKYTYGVGTWSNASGTITGNRTITANFTRATRKYTITIINPTYGKVCLPDGTEIANGAKVDYDTQLTIHQTSITGYTSKVITPTSPNGSLGTTGFTVSGDATVEFTRTANVYEVVFNGNGATSGSMSNQSFTYDQAKNLTANTFARNYIVTFKFNAGTDTTYTVEDSNYTFNGWATSASGAKVYSDKQSVSNLTSTNNGAVTLYANWTPESITLPTPTRTGYTFKGWATSATATSGVTGSYTPTGNVTLYAIWEINKYAIIIKGASYGSVTTKVGSTLTTITNGTEVNYGTVLTVTPTPATGYTTTVSSGTATISSTGGTITVDGSETITFTRTANTYTVKFNGNGATAGSMSDQTFTYDKAQNLTAEAFSKIYTVTYNYNGNGTANTTATSEATFQGWATSSTGSVAYTDGQSVSNLTATAGGTVNLYAQWSAMPMVSLPTPTKTGYGFAGWATSPDAAVGITGVYRPTGDVTLYAIWVEGQAKSVLFPAIDNVKCGSQVNVTGQYIHSAVKSVSYSGYGQYTTCKINGITVGNTLMYTTISSSFDDIKMVTITYEATFMNGTLYCRTTYSKTTNNSNTVYANADAYSAVAVFSGQTQLQAPVINSAECWNFNEARFNITNNNNVAVNVITYLECEGDGCVSEDQQVKMIAANTTATLIYNFSSICENNLNYMIHFEKDGYATSSSTDGTIEYDYIQCSITWNLTNCTVTNMPSYITAGDSLNLTVVPSTGYALPDSIIVTGYVEHTWDPDYDSEQLWIGSATGPITITIEAVEIPMVWHTIFSGTQIIKLRAAGEQGTAFSFDPYPPNGTQIRITGLAMGGSSSAQTTDVTYDEYGNYQVTGHLSFSDPNTQAMIIKITGLDSSHLYYTSYANSLSMVTISKIEIYAPEMKQLSAPELVPDPLDTGCDSVTLDITNNNSVPVTASWSMIDDYGDQLGSGSFTIPANTTVEEELVQSTVSSIGGGSITITFSASGWASSTATADIPFVWE